MVRGVAEAFSRRIEVKTFQKGLFKAFKRPGQVSLYDLQRSFSIMNMAIDHDTFAQYKLRLLAPSCDCLDLKAFLAFHQVLDAFGPSLSISLYYEFMDIYKYTY